MIKLIFTIKPNKSNPSEEPPYINEYIKPTKKDKKSKFK